MHLERLTFILEVVGQKGEATVAEICAHSDLPKPSAYRLVQDLVSVGLLEPVTRGTFSIGSRLKRITQSDHSDRALLEVIAPALKKAATQYGAAFFLSRLRGKSVEIIHVETPDTGVSYLHPGLGKRPLHACSCSKAVAASACVWRADGVLRPRARSARARRRSHGPPGLPRDPFRGSAARRRHPAHAAEHRSRHRHARHHEGELPGG